MCICKRVALGVKKENLIMCDTKGVIYQGRPNDMNPYKEKFQNNTKARTLSEAMKGADVILGLSVKGAVTKEMVKSMAKNPVIFAGRSTLSGRFDRPRS